MKRVLKHTGMIINKRKKQVCNSIRTMATNKNSGNSDSKHRKTNMTVAVHPPPGGHIFVLQPIQQRRAGVMEVGEKGGEHH